MPVLVILREVERPTTGGKIEFELDLKGSKDLSVAEIIANIEAAKLSVWHRMAYYVSSIIMDSRNFTYNPTPSYWQYEVQNLQEIRCTASVGKDAPPQSRETARSSDDYTDLMYSR